MEPKIAAATGFAPATSVSRQHPKLGADLRSEVNAAMKQAQAEGITNPEHIQARINMARGKVLHAHEQAKKKEDEERLAFENKIRARARELVGPDASLVEETVMFQKLYSVLVSE